MFNQRFPSAPTLDTAGLLELIKSPQKAAELWAKYEQVKGEYEALRAEFEAERAELKKKELDLLDKLGSFAKETEDYAKARGQFESEKAQWKLQKDLWLKKLDEVEKSNALTAMGHSDAYKELNHQRLQLENAQVAFEDVRKAAEQSIQNRLEAAAKREATVAAREEKADLIAKAVAGL